MSDSRKIAIVDDHPMFRKGLVALINMFPGYTVSVDASNGKDFFEKLNGDASLPDIVLMDINMPEMDGYTTTRELQNKFPSVKVIALSTMDAEGAIIKMVLSGAKGYVLKDAEPSELRTAFDEVMLKGYFYNEIITRKVLSAVSHLADDTASVSTFAKLNEKEIQFLKLCCTELTYKEIAEKMFLSVRTVEGYRDLLCEKLNISTRVGLAMYAVKNGIVRV